MPEIEIGVTGVTPVTLAMTPQLRFELSLAGPPGQRVDALLLQAQVMIEAARRTYIPREGEALIDLFGAPARYARTLRPMLWTHAAAAVPGFTGAATAAIDVPCSHDLCVAGGKYFFALEGGDVPLTFQFSGTVFYRDAGGGLQVGRVPWTSEASFALPVAAWHDLMAAHYGDGAWLCLRREVVDRLLRHKARRGLPSYEDAIVELLEGAREPVAP